MNKKVFEEPILEKIAFLSNDIITQKSWWWDDFIEGDEEAEFEEPDNPFD